MHYDDYEDLKQGLKELPITWYPALLIIIVEAVIDNKIFNNRYGIMDLVNKIINKKGFK